MQPAGGKVIGVLGASTMIGRHLVTRIRRMGLLPVAIDLTAEDEADSAAAGLESRRPDLSDPAWGAASLSDLDALVCVDRVSDDGLRDDRGTDAQAARRPALQALFRSCRAAAVRRIVWLGSPTSLAPVSAGRARDVSAHPRLRARASGQDPHAPAARFELDRFVQELALKGLPISLVFAPTVIGEYDGNYSMGRVLLALARGEITRIADAPKEVAHPDDVARGLLLAAERGEPGRCYVLGGHRTRMAHIARYVSLRCKQPTPRAMSAAELALRRLLLQAGRPARRIEDIRIMGLMASRQRFDARLAQTALGYHPRIGLRETLDRALKWIHRTTGGRAVADAAPARVMGAGERAFAATVFASGARGAARRAGAAPAGRPARRRAAGPDTRTTGRPMPAHEGRGAVMRRLPLPETIANPSSDA